MKEEKNLLIIIAPPHGENVPGKGSPATLYPKVYPYDEHLKFREYIYAREKIIPLLTKSLRDLGYQVESTNTTNLEYVDSKGKPLLSKTVAIANAIQTSKKKLLISPHTNAKGMGNKWQTLSDNKNFYCVFTTIKQTKSDIFAEYVYEEFEKEFLELKGITNKVDGDKDLEQNFTVLTGSSYYAALIEFGFQDIKEHVEFLLKPETPERYVRAMVKAVERFNKYFDK